MTDHTKSFRFRFHYCKVHAKNMLVLVAWGMATLSLYLMAIARYSFKVVDEQQKKEKSEEDKAVDNQPDFYNFGDKVWQTAFALTFFLTICGVVLNARLFEPHMRYKNHWVLSTLLTAIIELLTYCTNNRIYPMQRARRNYSKSVLHRLWLFFLLCIVLLLISAMLSRIHFSTQGYVLIK